MNNRPILFGFLVLLLFGAVFFVTSAPPQSADPSHDFEGLCDECHRARPGAGEPVLVRDVDLVCLQCHAMSKDNSHPTGVVPTLEIPSGFRLDGGGRLSCVSCHHPHLEVSPERPYRLRGEEVDRGFCGHCHTLGDGGHGGAVFLAHAKVYTPPGDVSVSLDRISRGCLACHDALSAGDVHFCTSGLDRVCLSHPVGVVYDQIQARNRELNPRSQLDPAISFIEGKLGCTSCHSIYSTERKLLTLSNRGSALCLHCHRF
ncbi:cytochrome c3 family protein [Desulfuromonas sp.]|uniref:cytochrome c3 family protein n=1 Tax=Desulfuromonas sp. TaxID=892 RepID=UPI0025C0D2D4|nr:cytochrome c3 family protein [Desulfuromonas sp.]